MNGRKYKRLLAAKLERIEKMKKEAQEKKEVKTKEDIDINDITQQIANLLKIRVPKKEEDNKV